jgi:hypothetical protein
MLEQMKKTVAGEGSPTGPGIREHAGLGIFSYEPPGGVVWCHTGQFPAIRHSKPRLPMGALRLP